jgi:hypothetical protein
MDIKHDFVARDLFVRKHANQMSCPMVKVRRASRPEDGLKGRDPDTIKPQESYQPPTG